MIYLILLGYLIMGVYLARTRPVNDMERSMLGLDRNEMADRFAREFGGTLPRRYSFRLPLEYWLWAWAQDLFTARLVGLAVGGVGFWITMAWGGPIAGLVVLSSPTLVGALVSASYVPYVATLWVGGLWALSTGYPIAAWWCVMALATLRPTSWWQALWLAGWIHPTLPLVLVVYWLVFYQEVLGSQGWVRLLRGQACPVQGIPRDGWFYGAKTLFRRYEPWGVWFTVAGVLGHWSSEATWLLGLTGGLFVLTHLPRMLIRPKWAVGYIVEWLFPVAVAIGLLLTSP